jgi:hypothetical protein
VPIWCGRKELQLAGNLVTWLRILCGRAKGAGGRGHGASSMIAVVLSCNFCRHLSHTARRMLV